MAKQPAVYIMASKPRGVLYIGVTSNLKQRVAQHKLGKVCGFSNTYKTRRLVWSQSFDSMTEAIEAEKKLKRYKRDWKIELVEESNPDWDDLAAD